MNHKTQRNFIFLILILLIPILSGPPSPANSSTNEHVEAELFVNTYLSMIANKKPDYFEDFTTNKKQWEIGVLSNGEKAIINGEYYISANTLNFPDWTYNGTACPGLKELDNFLFEIEGSFVDFNSKTNLGVKMRENPQNKIVDHIFITPDCDLVVHNSRDIVYVSKKSSLIKPGNQKNQLTIIAVGQKIAVLINGQLAAFVTENLYTGHKGIFFISASHSQNDLPILVKFDNLKIWNLKPVKP